MPTVNPHRAGLVLAVILGGWHLIWVILVALGWAQAILHFYFRIHFLTPVWTVLPFRFVPAIILIVVTTAIGYVVGYILGVLWNRVHRSA